MTLDIVCAACARACTPPARFCGWCGAALAPAASVPEPRGERKQATVLFADIVGSTEFIAGGDAEQAMNLLQPVVEAMAQAVHRFDGTILRTLGDGLKAAFGAPLAREGHALLAAQAALAMREAVARLDNPPPIRIGLHSGEVVVGALHTGSGVELEAQGMTVHLASRIEQSAEPGEILLSGDCRTLIGPDCETEPLGPRALRGVAVPVELYRLTGLRPAVASDQFRGVELAPLRGRTAELEVLRGALRDAENGVASVIGISAPAGVGKSRLCFEFSEWCCRRRVDVVEGRAHVFGQATPLLPVLEVLRTFLRVSVSLDAAEARDRISRRIAALDSSLTSDLPILLDFLGLRARDLPIPPLDPRDRAARVAGILRAMIKAAGRRTSVLIIEDLHWLDEASGAFMQTVAEAIVGTRFVVILNFRPSWTAPLMALPHYRAMPLEELASTEAHQIVRDQIGDAPELRALVGKIARQSGGNPFFAQQLVLSLVQGGVLTGDRGRHHLADPPPPEVALPATVEAVIGASLDRLEASAKDLLLTGAIIGKEFPRALVEEVAGLTEADAQPLFDRLIDAELVQAHTLNARPGFVFRHPLIQEVAYAAQLRSRRAKLHAQIAAAMQGHEWGRLDECAGLLSHHCEAAGQFEAAAGHLQRAARWVGRTNSAQALTDWKKVRSLLRGQPRSEENDKLRALASGQILNFGWREGITADEAKPYAEEALRYAREVGDRMHEPLLLGAYGRIMAASGAADDYVRLVGEAVTLAEADGDPGRLGTVNSMLCQAYWQSGRLNPALAAADRALAAFAEQRQVDGQVVLGLNVNQVLGFDIEHWVRCQRARVLVWLGRFDEAESLLSRLIQVDPDLIVALVQFIPHFALTELAWYRGDSVSAARHAAAVWDFAEQSGAPYLRVIALGCRGLAACASGAFAAACQHFRDAVDLARNAKAGLELEARLLANLADAYLQAGDAARAGACAAEAIEVGHRRTQRMAECHGRFVAAAAMAAQDQAAESMLKQAEELRSSIGAAFLRPMRADTRNPVDAAEQRRS